MALSKSIVTVVMSLAFSASMASESSSKETPEWFVITNSSDNTKIYSGKSGSLEITSTKSGVPVVTIIGQIEDKTNSEFQYNKWYVPVDDCRKESGQMAILSISGDYIDEVGFVLGGNNIASGIANVICGGYDIKKKDIEGKGL